MPASRTGSRDKYCGASRSDGSGLATVEASDDDDDDGDGEGGGFGVGGVTARRDEP